MNYDNPEKVAKWLQDSPSFQDLCQEFPSEWERVQQELADVFSRGRTEDMQAYLKRLSGQAATGKNPYQATMDKKGMEAGLSLAIRYSMASMAIKRHCISVASGVESGKVRFNFLNGIVSQMLLFEDGLIRKPVSLFWFRLVWPLIWQKRFLMPLVQPEGIYCFYSKDLIGEITALTKGKKCLEIGAGDGTLSRFLTDKGVSITATDDYSWKHAVKYPETVIKRDAKEALSLYSPEVVICSWPPSNNTFEKHVFRTKSVSLYIVIGSRHQFAAGNWSDYRSQTTFRLEEEPRLSRLLLPPELDSAVYVFRRNAGVA